MKLKTKDQSESQKLPMNSLNAAGFYLPAVLVVALVLIFSAVFFKYLFSEKTETAPAVQVSDNENKVDSKTPFDADAVKITTNKQNYVNAEQISLHIENFGTNTAYFQPCKDIKVFEKKEGDTWKLMELGDGIANYQDADFEKKEGDVECNIESPVWGDGIYRAVVPIYFNCAKPSPYACEWSKVFRSNEFKIEIITDLGSNK